MVGVWAKEMAEMLRWAHSDLERAAPCFLTKPYLHHDKHLPVKGNSVFPELKGPLGQLVNLRLRMAVRAFGWCPLLSPFRRAFEHGKLPVLKAEGAAPCLSAVLLPLFPLASSGTHSGPTSVLVHL